MTEYPYYQVGNHASITPDDPTFSAYQPALNRATAEANRYQDDGTCGAVYGVWEWHDADTLPSLVALVTFEGVFVRQK